METTERTNYFNFRIINVKLRKSKSSHEANPEEYIRLFKAIFNKKIHAESSPNKHCIIRSLFEYKEKGKTIFLYGVFAQFTYIQNERWFNLNSLDLDNEFKIPNGLFPDAKMTYYVFVPTAHRFCYKIDSDFNSSPYAIRQFLELSLTEIAKQDEFVQVDVETDKASLRKILNAKFIKKLSIDINYSNLDIGDDLKKFIETDIKNSNSSRFKLEATSQPNQSIDIDNSTILKGAIELSTSDGETEATILDENNRVKKIKTTQFPRKETVRGKFSNFNMLVYEKIMRLFRNAN